jgi:hypothetical protein
MAVYLIHFDEKYKHAAHYLGYSESEHTIEQRLEDHKAGRGAKLLAALNRAGVGYSIARIWKDGDRKFERRLKKGKNIKTHCPICCATTTRKKQG